jgi:hypothetical protein
MEKSFFARAAIFVCLILVLLSTDLFAGSRDHDGGFFLRLSAGTGYAQSEYADPATFKLYGVSGDMNIAVGMGVLPNLALHATLFGWSLSEPTAEVGGSSGDFPGDATLGSFGIGFTYYLMPVNMYLSGSVGFSALQVEILGAITGETDLGPAFDVTLGKEWWVGGNWGLGVAGGFGYHSVPDKDVDENWSGYSLGIRFTATLN